MTLSSSPFATPIERNGDVLVGPWRKPAQMLQAQTYDDHASIHDDATAQNLGFKAATIEGPTHFSQFDPLCFAKWGQRWFEQGCISAHYKSPVYAGETVRAILEPKAPNAAAIRMERSDGVEILRGSVSVGPDHPPSALEQRLSTLAPLAQPVILEGVRLNARTPRRAVRMQADQMMGDLYPFTLQQKLARITEPSPWYEGAADAPFGAMIPIEMMSVLLNHTAGADTFYARGPVVGLFADQEIRLVDGPLLVGETYEIDREVVAMSGSRRTESLWIRTRVYKPGSDVTIASMLLNSALMKESYGLYAEEFARLYG